MVNAGKSYFTGALPELWLFALGGLFVLVTLFLPKGIVGTWDQLRDRLRTGLARKAAEPPADSGEPMTVVRAGTSASPGWASPPKPQPAE